MTFSQIVVLALVALVICPTYSAPCSYNDIGGRVIVGVRGDRDFVFWQVPEHDSGSVKIDEDAFTRMEMPQSEKIESLVVVPSQGRVELLVRANYTNALFRRYSIPITGGDNGALEFGQPSHSGHMFGSEGHLVYGRVGEEIGSFVVLDSGAFVDFFDAENIQELSAQSVFNQAYDEAEGECYPRWSQEVIEDSSLEKVKWKYGVLFRYAGEEIVAENQTTSMGQGAISYSVHSGSLNCTFAVLDSEKYKFVHLLPEEIEAAALRIRHSRSVPSGKGRKSVTQGRHHPFPYIVFIVVNFLLPLFFLVLCLIVYCRTNNRLSECN